MRHIELFPREIWQAVVLNSYIMYLVKDACTNEFEQYWHSWWVGLLVSSRDVESL